MGDGSTALEPSILKTIKKMLGMGDEYVAFDLDLIVNINTIFSNLTQMGIGPITTTVVDEVSVDTVDGFSIDDNTETWDQFFEGHDNPLLLQQVKTYIYIKVRLLFDPPANGNLLAAMKENAKELEVRLYTQVGGY